MVWDGFRTITLGLGNYGKWTCGVRIAGPDCHQICVEEPTGRDPTHLRVRLVLRI